MESTERLVRTWMASASGRDKEIEGVVSGMDIALYCLW
jgi:hypothetical protein